MVRATINLLLAVGLALPTSVRADEPASVVGEATAQESMLDVHVGSSIDRADALAAKIRDEVVRLLRAHRIELDAQRTMRLSIGVGGEPYAYRVTLAVMKDGALIGEVREPWTCECTHEELLVRIAQSVVDLVPTLQGRDAVTTAPAPAQAPAPRLVVQADAPLERSRPIGRAGGAGLGLLISGLALAGSGLALAVVGERRDRGPQALEGEGTRRDLAPGGGAMLGIGAGFVIAGAVLLAIDRRRARAASTSLALLTAPRLGGISLTTRF